MKYFLNKWITISSMVFTLVLLVNLLLQNTLRSGTILAILVTVFTTVFATTLGQFYFYNKFSAHLLGHLLTLVIIFFGILVSSYIFDWYQYGANLILMNLLIAMIVYFIVYAIYFYIIVHEVKELNEKLEESKKNFEDE